MDYRVSLSLSVTDPHALWSAAAACALTAPGMTLDDVIETIGSEHDPDIADCIALLLLSPRITGARIEDFACRRAGKPERVADVTPLPTRPRATRHGLNANA